MKYIIKDVIKGAVSVWITWLCILVVIEWLDITTNEHIALIGFVGGVIATLIVKKSTIK